MQRAVGNGDALMSWHGKFYTLRVERLITMIDMRK
jgi:hypothetical protein